MEGRYKVYIIDEAHMLTEPAFNALLKTLEEPPGHNIFILATTESQKIPYTIMSRCQRFDFRRISEAQIIEQLRRICLDEQIEYDEKVLNYVVREADGSLRDAESILDQVIAYSGTHIAGKGRDRRDRGGPEGSGLRDGEEHRRKGPQGGPRPHRPHPRRRERRLPGLQGPSLFPERPPHDKAVGTASPPSSSWTTRSMRRRQSF